MRYLCLTPALLLLLTTAAIGADPPAPAQEVTLSNPLAAQPMEGLTAIVDRPLFSPGRRGPSTPLARRDPEPQTSLASPPNLVLSGVVMDGASARVVVQVGAEKRIIRAQIGDEIEGWTVKQIAGRKLVLSREGRFATYSLFSRDVDQ
jgi:general secretion pathway protein N